MNKNRHFYDTATRFQDGERGHENLVNHENKGGISCEV